jgi:hypothetical protein
MRDPDPACHQVYLLTLWRETVDAPWRAALRQAGAQERIGFADLESLALFLLRLNDSRVQSEAPIGDDMPPTLDLEAE